MATQLFGFTKAKRIRTKNGICPLSTDLFRRLPCSTDLSVVLLCHVAWNPLKFLNAHRKNIATPRQVLKILLHKKELKAVLKCITNIFPPLSMF